MIAPARPPHSSDIDTDLMLQASLDDDDAFVELYDKHRHRVVQMVNSMMWNSGQSEDLVQQVFLRAYRARKQFVPSAKFTTWLFTITRNTVLNSQRTLRRRPEPLLPSQSPTESFRLADLATSRDDEPLERISSRERKEWVRHAVSQLKTTQRSAVELVDLNGMSYREAAEEMGVTIASVKQLLSRGRVKLRQILMPLEN
ncbi:RNA polymerase sigma factor [Stieleria varia]|uniref:RNA polymerase sigma factor n=1 Tax=Stieleria varia TaxID=2528005 RepID=A0A5C6AS89_9BACT|nr:RNA polymerase sigma factor [Stieleria varia]TWU02560.1 ECF RNA polymerase sigma factor SigW [Stieleria varia]